MTQSLIQVITALMQTTNFVDHKTIDILNPIKSSSYSWNSGYFGIRGN